MAEAHLKFDLSEPAEADRLLRILRLDALLGDLHDVQQALRSRLKHGEPPDQDFVEGVYRDLSLALSRLEDPG